MDFAQTAEEQALVAALRETLQQCCPVERIRAWEAAGVSCDAECVAALADGGFLEVGLPWGACPDFGALVLLAEESGRFLAPPLLPWISAYAAFLLQDRELGPRLTAGELPATPAPGRSRVTLDTAGLLQGPAAGTDLFDVARHLLVPVAGGQDGEARLACLRPDAPGVRAERVAMQSGAPSWRLALEGAAPQAVVRLPAGRTRAAVDRWRTCLAAWSVGAGSRALDVAVAHAAERRQFGHPIGSYQSVQNRLVDAAVRLEEARMLTLRAGALVAAGDGDPGPVPALARRLAGRAFHEAALAATMTFGGYGFIVDSDVQLFYRRGKETQVRYDPPVSAADGPLLAPFRPVGPPNPAAPAGPLGPLDPLDPASPVGPADPANPADRAAQADIGRG